MKTQQEKDAMQMHEPMLTEEQKRLAGAKEKASEALSEIHTEIETIKKYLPLVNREKQIDFIKDLVHVQDELDSYLEVAEISLNEYSTTRKELISFADKDDIFFIPRLLNNAIDGVERILPILKKRQNEVWKYRDIVSEDDAEKIVCLHVFFITYRKRLDRMWKVYEKLYDDVYNCQKEEYGKRLDRQFVSTFRIKAIDIFDPLRVVVSEEIAYRNSIGPIVVSDNEPIIIHEKKGVVVTANKAILSTNNIYDLAEIDRKKEEITRSIKKIAPDLKLEEFTDRDSLAEYIHCNKILHEDANSILKGYIQLNYLDNIKKEVLGLVTPKKKRGRKRCDSFNDLDKQMLRELYIKIFEQEKGNIYRRSKNAYAALFLIAIFRGAVDKATEKVTAFCKIIHNTIENIKLDIRTVQRVVEDYNLEYSRTYSKISERIKRYIEIVKRIALKLENTSLILG
jgi:hypothetical protein